MGKPSPGYTCSPALFIQNELFKGKLRASTALLGRLGVLAAMMLFARLIMLVVGATTQ
jgi:hypothetical protein